jgi:hypothetical protein
MTKPNTRDKQLSPGQAIAVGTIVFVTGCLIVLLGLGVLPTDPAKMHAPGWIIAAAGLVFVLGGTSVFNGYAPAKHPCSTSIQYFLGIGIIVLMLIISGWIAFGPGERHFTSSSTFSPESPVSERSGRTVFGLGFLILLALFVYGVVSSVKKKMD